MDAQYRYFENPLKFEFDAQVVETQLLEDGRFGVILDQTYFYPTGGGQESDRGVLGDVPVVDVRRDEATSSVIHVVESELLPPPGPVLAKIDGRRRLRHMQHHSAQHLLSACFTNLFDLETLSAHISGDSPSSIDLPETVFDAAKLAEVEALANEIVFENREVKTYIVEQEQAQTVPLRRPPKVEGDVRVVEIDGFDYSACGGTHCLSTGMIGLVKIIKTERQNRKTRLYFMAGAQALEYFQAVHEAVSALAEELSIHWGDLVGTVRGQAEELKQAQRDLRTLRKERIAFEAEELAAAAKPVGDYGLVMESYEARPVDELQALAKLLMGKQSLIAALATYDGEKTAVVVACSEDVDIRAGELIKNILAPIDGRGGGGPQLAQGGGSATREQFQAIFDQLGVSSRK